MSSKCLPFRSTRVHSRFLVEFVLLSCKAVAGYNVCPATIINYIKNVYKNKNMSVAIFFSLESEREGEIKYNINPDVHVVQMEMTLTQTYETMQCSNIPVTPAYVVYISQLIRFSRSCGSYHDFLDGGLLLKRKLLNQGFIMVKLKS